MKILVLILKSAIISLAASYALVLLFIGFGPAYINGELAMDRSHVWTLVLSAFMFLPLLWFFSRRDRESAQKQ